MTRVNLVEPKELTRLHLIAEYKEIMRLPGSLKKSLSRKRKKFKLSEIPKEYVLGKGHVKFFYDKMKFVKERFEKLVAEMIERGYSPTYTDSSIFIPEDFLFYNDYVPDEKAIELSRMRINERINGGIVNQNQGE